MMDEGIVEGIVMPWNETSHFTPDPNGERFLPGSLTRTVQQRGARLKLFLNHDHAHAIGKAVKLDPRHPSGLWAAWQLFDTPAGQAARAEVEQGALDSFSVGFDAVRSRRGADGAREIVEAALGEVSLLPIAAYDGARVLATRARSTPDDDVAAWLAAHPIPPHDLTGPPVVLPR